MYDILIIGSGPAGLSAAIYAKRANYKVAVIEKEYAGTGQIAESNKVDNYLGIPGISGFDLGEKFRSHADDFGVEFIDKEVIAIHQENDKRWKVVYDDKTDEMTKTVIYAAGATPRKIGAKGEETFIGRGVSFCAICDGSFFKEKKVAVVGGGDTAVDDALLLSDIANKVYLVHRREEFRASKSSVELLKKKENVEFILNSTVKEIVGDKCVEEIILSDGKKLEVQGVFEAVGTIPTTKIVSGIVELDNEGYIVADETGKTSKEGFFAAGDVRTKKLRQVATAVSDGANAVYSVEEFFKHTEI